MTPAPGAGGGASLGPHCHVARAEGDEAPLGGRAAFMLLRAALKTPRQKLAMSYQDGFRDCLDVIEHLLVNRGLYNDKIGEIIEELRAAIAEKKIAHIMYELGL